MSINIYSIFALLMVLTACFSYVNVRFIKLPATIGIMLISLLCSLILISLGESFPDLIEWPVSIIGSIDFETLLMRIMLSFLLFAGAIQIDVQKLKEELASIIAYSTIGVIISTLMIGSTMYFVFAMFDLQVPFIYSLLFGALISPTDPIAVLGILKDAKIPSSMEIKITGESLFNDGVGVVVFISLLDIASVGVHGISAGETAMLFIKEAGGGILWGLLLGYSGYFLIKSIDHYQVEVLITIAMVMGGYLLAQDLDISGPLAMVVAGIITGNKGKRSAMSVTTKDYVNKFWELIDEILNALLFMLIGFEIIVLAFNQRIIFLGLIAIVVVFLGRLISVFLPTSILSFRKTFNRKMLSILTWGGIRGGISVALALSLPKGDYRNIIVSITYIVVVFSILVQGLTIGKLAKRLSYSK